MTEYNKIIQNISETFRKQIINYEVNFIIAIIITIIIIIAIKILVAWIKSKTKRTKVKF